MYGCIDCGSPSGRIIWFEPNPHSDGDPWDDSFIPLVDSLETWLELWLAEKDNDLFEDGWKAKFGE